MVSVWPKKSGNVSSVPGFHQGRVTCVASGVKSHGTLLDVPFGLVPVAVPMTLSNSMVPEVPAVSGNCSVTNADLPGPKLVAEAVVVDGVMEINLPPLTSVNIPPVGTTLLALMSPLFVTRRVTT